MFNPNQLFLKRVIFEWKYNFSNWKMVVDWTIALYIVIPFLIFGVEQYVNLWNTSQNWLTGVPFNLLMSITAFFAWSGTTRLFIKEADQLFLWSRKKWIKKLMIRGIAYSTAINFIFNVVFFLLLAPLFIGHYEITTITFVNLFIITFIFKILLGLLKQLIELSFNGFKQVVVLKGTFVFFNILFVMFIPFLIMKTLSSLLLIILLLIFGWYLMNKRINIKGTFFDDVERERNQELKYVRFLLNRAGFSFQKVNKQKLRPILFRHSNLIFKKRTARNGLVEFCLKATLRNKTNVLYYIQLTAICVLIILTFPLINLLIWSGLGFILTNFVSLFWKMSMNSNFVNIFQWKAEDVYHASQKFLFIMALPGFMVISFFFGYQDFSWIGAFFILPVAVVVIYLMSKIVAFYIYITSKDG